MDIFWIIFGIIHILSFLILIISLRFLVHYTRRYKMEESAFTMLFGFIRIEHIITCYAVTILALIAGSTLFALYLMRQ